MGKQRIPLSDVAISIISSDASSFSENKEIAPTGAINHIFITYADFSLANVPAMINKKRKDIEKDLKTTKIKKEDKVLVIDNLIEGYKKELKDKIQQYINKRTILNPEKNLYYLHDEIEYYLDRPDIIELIENEDYFGNERGRIGRFMKVVLEEYAEKPYLERESIYFRDTIDFIKKNIGKLLLITLNKKRYYVRPHKVTSDTLSNHNYLIGYSTEAGTSKKEVICTMRISRITDYKAMDEQPLSQKEKDVIENELSKNDIMFFNQKTEKIYVKLTEAGKKHYQVRVHLRPAYNGITEDGVYIFDCSKSQAEFYFFKFGKDAEIISPNDLRKKFKDMYIKAAEVYDK